jgi:hypothetical protein
MNGDSKDSKHTSRTRSKAQTPTPAETTSRAKDTSVSAKSSKTVPPSTPSAPYGKRPAAITVPALERASVHSDDAAGPDAVDATTQNWLQELHTIDPDVQVRAASKAATAKSGLAKGTKGDEASKTSPPKPNQFKPSTSRSSQLTVGVLARNDQMKEQAVSKTRRSSITLSNIMHAVGELDKQM